MPTYVVSGLQRADGLTIFDMRLMVALGAITINARTINEHYKILEKDLSEEGAELFLRLVM